MVQSVWTVCEQYSHIAFGLANITLRSFDEAGKALTAIWCHTFTIATVGSTNGLTAQLRGTTIAGRTVASFRRNALLVHATRMRAMRPAKETRLCIESVASMAGTGAVQIASSMLAGNGARVNACALLVSHKLRKALAISRRATETMATIIRRAKRTIRHTVSRIHIWVIALAALLYAMKVYCRAVAPHRCMLVGLKEDGTGGASRERERERECGLSQ